MRAGPSEALYRQSLQTTSRCWTGNVLVLSGWGKGSDTTGSGKNKRDERKWTFEEVSKKWVAIKTKRSRILGINIAGTCLLAMWLLSLRRHDSYSGSVAEHGKSFCNVSCLQPSSCGLGNNKGDYPDVQKDGGWSCSSDEASVTDVERRATLKRFE